MGPRPPHKVSHLGVGATVTKWIVNIIISPTTAVRVNIGRVWL
jgi:hypothetical protein